MPANRSQHLAPAYLLVNRSAGTTSMNC